MPDAEHLDAIDHRRLTHALGRDDDAAHPASACQHRRREHAMDAAHRAVETELADDEQVGDLLARVAAIGDHHGDRDR